MPMEIWLSLIRIDGDDGDDLFLLNIAARRVSSRSRHEMERKEKLNDCYSLTQAAARLNLEIASLSPLSFLSGKKV